MNVSNKKTLVLFLALAILFGCRRGDTVRHGNLSYNASETFGAGTPGLLLAEAAGCGDTNQIGVQISSGANINVVGRHDITPLWWAAWAENYEGFVTLLDDGANPNAQRSDGYPIMYLIAGMEDSRFLAAALKHGGDPNLIDLKSGWPPLYVALLYGYEDNVNLLLDKNGNVNWQDPISGQTLPMVALSTAKRYELIYKLFQNGADPTLKDRGGKTIADALELVTLVADNNENPWRLKVVAYIQSKGISVNGSK